MALYETATFTTANDLIAAIKTFAEANGWTIDNYTTGTNNRLHLHKGDQHVDMQSTSSTGINMYGCTSYASGSAYNSQPGASAAKNHNFTVGAVYYLVSVAGGVYLIYLYSGYMQFTGFFMIQIKVGSWSGGACVIGANISGMTLGSSAHSFAQMYINGAWSASVAANGLIGSFLNNNVTKAQPNQNNAALYPLPVPLFLGLSTDGTKHQPLGLVPGLYRCNGGDVYSPMDILTIATDQYMILPGTATGIGGALYDYLIKLGA